MRRLWWRVQVKLAERRAAKEAAADDSDGKDGAKPGVPGALQNVKEKLKDQAKKYAEKLKTYVQAPGKLLKTLGRLDASALAAALGPALRIAATAGAVGAVGAAGVYAVANEREDARQIERAELAAVEERLDRLDTTTTAPASTVRAATADQLEALQATVDQISAVEPGEPAATQTELAALAAQIENLDPTDPTQIAALTERLDGLRVADPDQLAELQTAVAGLDFADPADVTALAEQIAALPASVSPAAVEALQARVDEIAAEPGVAPEDVDALQAQLDELAATTVDATQIEALETAVAALEAIDIPEPFDPAGLIAADEDNAASIDAAQAAVLAAQTEAAEAAAAAEALTVSLAATEAALDDIEAVFFADLERQWETGVPITLNENNGCSGAAQPFARIGAGYSASVTTPGPVQSFCARFVPVPPVIPDACSLPSFGSLRFYWEHGVVTAAARFGATSGANTLIRDNIRTASGGGSSSFFVLISDSDGPDAIDSAPAGDALQFVSRDLTAWDNFYEVEAFVNYETVGGGASPSVGAAVESVTARVEGNLTCTP